jgi:cytochrome c biogenesis protein CcmG/thiol:disulfide interchange protein DsbE
MPVKIVNVLKWSAVMVAAGVCLFPISERKLAFASTKPTPQAVAPDFSLTDGSGKSVHLASLKGKVVLINFFASWCPPCRMEIPGFERTYRSYKNRGFVVVGVALDDISPSFVKEAGLTYPVVVGNDRVVGEYGNVSSIPVSFLIGRDGRIIKKIMGTYPEASLRTDLERALRGNI